MCAIITCVYRGDGLLQAASFPRCPIRLVEWAQSGRFLHVNIEPRSVQVSAVTSEDRFIVQAPTSTIAASHEMLNQHRQIAVVHTIAFTCHEEQ